MKKQVAIVVWGFIGIIALGLLTYEIIFWFGTPVSQLNFEQDTYVTTTDNIKIHFTVHGTQYNDVNKPSIVLLHSGAWSSVEYTQVIQELQNDYVIYAFDMPGFGQSDKPQTHYTVDYLTRQMNDAFNQLFSDQQPIHLVGASIGGTVAVQLASMHPEYIQSMTLIDPIGFGDEINTIALWAQIPVLAELVLFPTRPVFDYIVDEGLQWRQTMHGGITEETRQELFAVSQLPKASRAKLSVLRTTISANHIAPDVRAVTENAASQIHQPVLLLWGERDTYAPLSQRDQAVALMPQAITPELLPAGHFAHIETPKKVTNHIKDFITTQSNTQSE